MNKLYDPVLLKSRSLSWPYWSLMWINYLIWSYWDRGRHFDLVEVVIFGLFDIVIQSYWDWHRGHLILLRPWSSPNFIKIEMLLGWFFFSFSLSFIILKFPRPITSSWSWKLGDLCWVQLFHVSQLPMLRRWATFKGNKTVCLMRGIKENNGYYGRWGRIKKKINLPLKGEGTFMLFHLLLF